MPFSWSIDTSFVMSMNLRVFEVDLGKRMFPVTVVVAS